MSRPGSPLAQAIARLLELTAEGVDGLPARGPVRGRRRQVAAPGRGSTPSGARAARPASPAPPAVPAEARAAERAPTPAPDAPAEPTPGSAWEELGLDALGAHLADCRRCKLHERRTQVVFGVGSSTARLMFVGEGPGHDEDLQGEPFVGAAGRLLTDMIEKGMGLRRADVYIANVVKCRPPGNRNPEPDEIASCQPFLRRQVELVQPEVLVALGKFAAQTLLGTREPISRLRGRWHAYAGTPLMPTFHPAYLLRTPSGKREAWHDLQLVMERLGLARP